MQREGRSEGEIGEGGGEGEGKGGEGREECCPSPLSANFNAGSIVSCNTNST